MVSSLKFTTKKAWHQTFTTLSLVIFGIDSKTQKLWIILDVKYISFTFFVFPQIITSFTKRQRNNLQILKVEQNPPCILFVSSCYSLVVVRLVTQFEFFFVFPYLQLPMWLKNIQRHCRFTQLLYFPLNLYSFEFHFKSENKTFVSEVLEPKC